MNSVAFLEPCFSCDLDLYLVPARRYCLGQVRRRSCAATWEGWFAQRRHPMKNKILTGILFVLVASSTVAAQKTGLPFIHDDYPKALAEAKESGLPIFVECWAPW